MSLRRSSSREGFTLVELLIVITIIAILAALIVQGLSAARTAAAEAEAKTMLSGLVLAVEQFKNETGDLPYQLKKKPDEDRNDFPQLYRALMYAPPTGGPSAPYLPKIDKEKLVVLDEDDPTGYRSATQEETEDEAIDKYILDPWGAPYVYRCNRGWEKKDFMVNPTGFDVYSIGPNTEDDTVVRTEGDENDDIVQGS